MPSPESFSMCRRLAARGLDVLRLRRDGLLRLELVRRLVDREADDGAFGTARIAVLVDLEAAEIAVRDRLLEHLRDHVRTRAVRRRDRVEHDLCGLRAVDRVRVDLLAAEPRLERLGELGACAL